jgi:hypothetical protein
VAKDSPQPVEELTGELASSGVRRHLEGLVSKIVSAAASREGRDDVLALIGTVPQAERADTPVDSL